MPPAGSMCGRPRGSAEIRHASVLRRCGGGALRRKQNGQLAWPLVGEVPTDRTGPLAAARACSDDSCGRFALPRADGCARGRAALVPRADSSVSASVQWARGPGRGGVLESTWPRPMRESRALYGCDLALAATLFAPGVCAVFEARRFRRTMTLEGAARASQCQCDIRCGALPHAKRPVWLWWTVERASLERGFDSDSGGNRRGRSICRPPGESPSE